MGDNGLAIRDEAPPKIVEHDLATCVDRVAQSPAACRRLLRALADRERLRDLATELRWEPTRYELSRLVETLSQEIARSSPRRWR